MGKILPGSLVCGDDDRIKPNGTTARTVAGKSAAGDVSLSSHNSSLCPPQVAPHLDRCQTVGAGGMRASVPCSDFSDSPNPSSL